MLELVRRIEKNDFEGHTLTLKVKFAHARQHAKFLDFQQITRSITVDQTVCRELESDRHALSHAFSHTLLIKAFTEHLLILD